MCGKSDRFMRHPGTCPNPFHDENDAAEIVAQHNRTHGAAEETSADQMRSLNQECATLRKGCIELNAKLAASERRVEELREALTRMLRHFADEDGGLCIECGEVTGKGKGCDTCYVLAEAESVLKRQEGR
jgi:hypothetical protein